MGRKRLMAVLTAMLVTAGLSAAPAGAQTLGVPGIGQVGLGPDGVEIDLDLELTDDVKLDPKLGVEVGPDGPEVTTGGGVEVGDRKVDLGRDTDPTPAAPSPSPTPTEPTRDADRDDTTEPTPPARTPAPRPTPDDEVAAAGGDTGHWSPRRSAQFEAFRALQGRMLGFGSTDTTAVLPGVELAPRRAALPGTSADGTGFAAPDVAPGLSPGVNAAGAGTATQATFASSPANVPAGAQVPLPLQVLTGVLVAGAALAWHVTRRQLGWALSGLRRAR